METQLYDQAVKCRDTYKPPAKLVIRGEIYMAELPEGVQSEQTGYKPVVVIVQNDAGNTYSSTTIVAVITSKTKSNIPTHFDIELLKTSTVLCEQIQTISKSRLRKRMGKLTPQQMEELDYRIKVSLGLI